MLGYHRRFRVAPASSGFCYPGDKAKAMTRSRGDEGVGTPRGAWERSTRAFRAPDEAGRQISLVDPLRDAFSCTTSGAPTDSGPGGATSGSRTLGNVKLSPSSQTCPRGLFVPAEAVACGGAGTGGGFKAGAGFQKQQCIA